MGATDRKKVLILGGSRLQAPAIEVAKRLGFWVICADYDPDAVGFALADQSELISTLDAEAVLALAKRERVAFVITSTSDAPVRTASFVSEQLDLPVGISYADSICATHKDAMRRRLAKYNVPIPEFRVCSNLDEFVEALNYFEYRGIIKPADSAASRGVKLIDSSIRHDDPEELFERGMSFSRKRTLMVERCISGTEVSVEGMTVNGKTHILAITDKMVTEPPYFVELGHSEPALLEDAEKVRIEDVARAAIEAVGIVNGPSHTEIMITDSGPMVIEIAARLGGDYITSRLVPLSTGFDMVGASVELALGMPVDFPPPKQDGSAVRFIVSDTGVISDIKIDSAIYDLPGFEELELYKKSGDAISEPHSSNDRVGHVICTGPDALSARETAEKALSMIHVSLS